MFWDKEKIIYIRQLPEHKEGQPYIRIPREIDKLPSTMREDRETGKWITLWEEKLKYPYKTTFKFKLEVKTNIRMYIFDLPLEKEPDGSLSFIWNGCNIPNSLWSILKFSKDSPQGLQASCWHDALLFKKVDFIEQLHLKGIDITVGEYRRLTTLIFRQILKNFGVNVIKANIMAGAVGAWQFISPQWWGVEDELL